MYDNNEVLSEPTVVGAMWRYRWLVLFLAIAFAGLGFLFGTRTEDWTAEASLAVQDPRFSSVLEQTGSLDPERYVEDQADILRSRAVARRATELAAAQEPPVVVDVDVVADELRVDVSSSSNLITLSYSDPDPLVAQVMVNATAEAYREVGRASAETAFTNALLRVDESMDEIQAELVQLRAQIATLRQPDLLHRELDRQLFEAVDRVLVFEGPPVAAESEEIELNQADLSILRARVDALRSALDSEEEDPELQPLLQDEQDARNRLAGLATSRDQLAVNAELAGSGVVFYSPAEQAEPSGGALFVVLGLILGASLGAGLAYLLASRRQRFTSRSEPERVLQAPLMADVPSFKQERIRTPIPVADVPTSASAESFRFVAAGIRLQQLGGGSPQDADAALHRAFGSIVTVSAGLGDGKTVVTANTALAAANEGTRVLAVDADFGNQGLSRILMPNNEPRIGITELARRMIQLPDAVSKVTLTGGGSIDVLARGSENVTALDFFNSLEAAEVFPELEASYDLVLIDAPPLLNVAYTSTLVRYADRVLVVVTHRGGVAAATEVRHRLTLIGTPVLGYVYNQAPLRPEMTLTSGSLADVLGAGPATQPADR